MRTITIVGKVTVLISNESVTVLQVTDDATISGLPTAAAPTMPATVAGSTPLHKSGFPKCGSCGGQGKRDFVKADGEVLKDRPCYACMSKGFQSPEDVERDREVRAERKARLMADAPAK